MSLMVMVHRVHPRSLNYVPLAHPTPELEICYLDKILESYTFTLSE